MLIYGPSEITSFVNEDTIIFNVTSLNERYNRLSYLVPANDFVVRLSEKSFDLSYADYILTNDFAFTNMFSIVNFLYLGRDVLLLFSDFNYSNDLAQSLLKLIQQRYGYNGYKINTIEDYEFALNSIHNGEFNPDYGLANLDIDKERFAYITATQMKKDSNRICVYLD